VWNLHQTAAVRELGYWFVLNHGFDVRKPDRQGLHQVFDQDGGEFENQASDYREAVFGVGDPVEKAAVAASAVVLFLDFFGHLTVNLSRWVLGDVPDLSLERGAGLPCPGSLVEFSESPTDRFYGLFGGLSSSVHLVEQLLDFQQDEPVDEVSDIDPDS